jgi:hypothetical protein
MLDQMTAIVRLMTKSCHLTSGIVWVIAAAHTRTSDAYEDMGLRPKGISLFCVHHLLEAVMTHWDALAASYCGHLVATGDPQLCLTLSKFTVQYFPPILSHFP